MATLVSRANGNFTAAGTWEVLETAAGSILTTLTAYYNNLTTTYSYNTAFTVANGDVITGVLLYVVRLTASPTVTFSVALSDDNGVTATREVTVNASDLAPGFTVGPANGNNGCWHFFKFGSTLTGLGTATYRIGVKVSTGSTFQVGVYYATAQPNWAHMLTTNATAAPASGDSMFVLGELTGAGAGSSFTVTMNNNNTTSFGPGSGGEAMHIGYRGTVDWSTGATTNLRLNGMLMINAPDAVFSMGTPGGTAIDRANTATLEFVCASNGQHGVVVHGGAFKAKGESRTSGKNVVQCKLSADVAAAATTISVDTDTGWLNGDEVALASTTRTHTESEERALNANAGASSFTISAGLTNAHKGSAPVFGEVILLTRNVRVRPTATNTTYIQIGQGGDVNCEWTDFKYFGTAVQNKRGFDDGSGGDGYGTGSLTLSYCCIRNSADQMIRLGSSTTIAVSDTVLWTSTGDAISVFNTLLTGSFTRVTVIYTTAAGSAGVFCNNGAISFTDIVIVATMGYGMYMPSCTLLPAMSGITIHSCNGYGLIATGVRGAVGYGRATIGNLTIYRTGDVGIILANCYRIVFNTLTIFGATTTNLKFTPSWLNGPLADITFNGAALNGDSTFSTSNGFQIDWGTSSQYICALHSIVFNNCDFGVAATGKTTHSTADINFANSNLAFAQVYFNNCRLASTTEIASGWMLGGSNSAPPGSGFFFHDKDQTPGAHFSYLPRQGTRVRNTSVVSSGASWSEELQFANFNIGASYSVGRFESGPRTAFAPAAALTVSVPVRKTGAYNGSQPTLVLRANPSAGIMADTVLDTMTVGADTWETLSGTTPVPSVNSILEFFVLGTGSAGSLYVSELWTAA